MQAFLDWIDMGEDTWIIHVFMIVLGTLLINLILKLILDHIHKKLLITQNLWDDAVLEAARKPLNLLVWVLGLVMIAEIIESVSGNEFFAQVSTVRNIAIILLLMLFMIRLIRNVEKNILHKNKIQDQPEADETTVRILAKLLRLSVIITSVLVVLQELEISVSGVVAFGGIGGIAVGFAAKDLLANFFGGLMIYLDRPFSVGDWVRSPDREIEGTVEDIGWRLTRIRTFDKRPLYIPNSAFANIAVENPSRMLNRRIYETIGLRYCDAAQMRTIVAAVKQMLESHEEIDSSQTLIVNFNSMASSSLDFFVYTFTKTTNWIHYHEVKQDVLLKIIDLVHAHGADIAFPTTTLDGIDALVAGAEKAG